MPQTSQVAADRTQRHLRICQELAVLGVQLTRAAAARALAARSPLTGEISPEDALVFARLLDDVCQTIRLEARIAADHEAAGRGGSAHGADVGRRAHDRIGGERASDRSAEINDRLATISEKLCLGPAGDKFPPRAPANTQRRQT